MTGILIFYTIFFILIVCFYLNKYEVFLFLFPILFYLNLDELLSDKAQLFGILNLAELNTILLIVSLLKKLPGRQKNDMYRKYYSLAIAYIVICFVFDINYSIRFSLSKGIDIDYGSIVRRILRYSMYTYAFMVVLPRISNKKLSQIVDSSFVVFSIFFSISTIIYNPESADLRKVISFGEIERNYGLFIGGDENMLASVLGMIFGYFLANMERHKINRMYYIAMVFIILGIINTGSRGGLISIGIVTVLYLIRNPIQKTHISIGIILIITLLLFYFGDKIINRLLLKSDDLYGTIGAQYYGLYGRWYKWVAYINDIIDHPSYLIAGAYLPRPYWWRWSPHNVFILILYYGGILFFIPFLRIIIKLFILPKSQLTGSFSLIYVLIPVIGMYMELNNVFYFLLPIFIMMSFGYSQSNWKLQKLKYS